ncbi:unnamed protein product [Vicia faba]|uniref:Uncharacterized protein n=1 Tax=Vicia faba TaxID=3906 RepID=A0AAV1AJF7_VICFA|nr:unnamed protein product [Vicia faba]
MPPSQSRALSHSIHLIPHEAQTSTFLIIDVTYRATTSKSLFNFSSKAHRSTSSFIQVQLFRNRNEHSCASAVNDVDTKSCCLSMKMQVIIERHKKEATTFIVECVDRLELTTKGLKKACGWFVFDAAGHHMA